VPRIHDYNDYTREFLALTQDALGRGEKLKGAYYLRSAEFYMFGDDPRRQATRRQFLQLMREHYGFQDNGHFDVPYETGALSSFRSAPPQPRGTIVIFGGFDGYIEELFPMQHYFGRAGYDVVSFDRPGQGVALEDGHLAMTHEWHKPVTAVLDLFHLDEVTLTGVSLGGCLAVRAGGLRAPRAPRGRRRHLHRLYRNNIGAAEAGAAGRALDAGSRWELTTSSIPWWSAMKDSLVTEWGARQGMRATGAKTPAEWLSQMRLYRTGDVSPLIEQDVLLLAGAEDHYVPLHQFYDQIRPRTACLFTRQEQAHEHIQIGNLGLQFRVIKDWIHAMQEKGNRVSKRGPGGAR